MERPSSLTEALFGIPSEIEVQPEITCGFVERGEFGVGAFRAYVRGLGYSEEKIEEILLEIYGEAKKMCTEDRCYETLLAAVALELGRLYLDFGSTKADNFLLEAFELRERLQTDQDLLNLSESMNSLGILHARNGRMDRAEVMFEGAYRVIRELYERDPFFRENMILVSSNLGTFYYETGRAEKALKHLEEVLKLEDPSSPTRAITYYNMALSYRDLGDFKRAGECFIISAGTEIRNQSGFIPLEEAVEEALDILELEELKDLIEEVERKGLIDENASRILTRLAEKIGGAGASPQNSENFIVLEDYGGEDWLRAGRRRFLLLNIIYYLQNAGGRKNGVSRGDLEEFLKALRDVDEEISSSIIKPEKPLEYTLRELLVGELIFRTPEELYLVNEERIRSEKDLIYWESVKRTFDEVTRKLSFGDYRNE